jgi:hypothetical protein
VSGKPRKRNPVTPKRRFARRQDETGIDRLERMTQRFAAPERFKLWPQAHLHTQWPGEGKPSDPAFDQFWASQFPSLANFQKQQEINPPALVALLDKIGPAILLTHSGSGVRPDHIPSSPISSIRNGDGVPSPSISWLSRPGRYDQANNNGRITCADLCWH